MEYKIGIASHHRAKRQLTLDYLEAIGFPRERVIMSVQCEEDRREYQKAGMQERVGEFIFAPASTAAGNRNTLLDHIPRGERIVLMDDDIKGISHLEGDHLQQIRTTVELDFMIEMGFSVARKHRAIGFGVYPVHNAYFMSKGYAERNIVDAGIFALVNTGMRFHTGIATKEDYEFCCRAIRSYGAFIRLNEYAVNSPAGHKGGCQEAWNDIAAARRVAAMLCAKYPDILPPNPKREGEVLMVKSKKRSGR